MVLLPLVVVTPVPLERGGAPCDRLERGGAPCDKLERGGAPCDRLDKGVVRVGV